MPDVEFERTFADLAHARLRDKAPGLLDFLVGFQLLDKNEDETHAVGVWGFKMGNEWLYAPVFFLNGQLKGDELLYLKSQDTFVPLKENWINYLLNRRPSVLGEAEPLKQPQLGIRQPDFSLLARPPYTGSKYASAGDLRSLVDYLGAAIHDDFKPFLPVLTSPPGGEKRAVLSDKFHLPNFIKRAGRKAGIALIAAMRKHAHFADAILKFYRMEDLIKAAEEAIEVKEWPVDYPRTGTKVRVVADGDNKGKTGKITKIETSERRSEETTADGTEINTNRTVKTVTVELDGGGVYTTDDSKRDLVEVRELDRESKSAAAVNKVEGTAPRVRVMLADRANVEDLDEVMLTDDEKERLQRDRYLVQDRRGDDEVARVYHRQISKTLQNPCMSGYFRVLLSSGEYQPMLIVTNPHGDSDRLDGDKNQAVIVNLDQDNRLRCTSQKQIFVDNEGHDAEDWQQHFNGLPSASSVREKDKVVFVNARCDGSMPFFVKRRIVTDDGQIMLYGEFDRFPYAPDDEQISKLTFPPFRGRPFNPSDARDRYPVTESRRPYGYEHCFIVTGKDGKKITQIGNDHFVPNGYKAIKIAPQDIEPWKLRDYARDREGETINGVKVPPRLPESDELAHPQTLADIEMQLFKSAQVFTLQPVSDGIEYWLKVNGGNGRPMSKLAALKELIERHGLRADTALSLLKSASRVKAPEYLVKKAQQPTAPALPEPILGYDDMTNVPTIYPQTELVPSNTPYAQRSSDLYDMDATFRAQQAANTGQKEVLDTSVVGGLVKTMDPNSVVDTYIGDLMLALDRIGRILFMYYWHYEKFKDRYGAQDMPELEDNLKNVYDGLGDLTLFLRQKTVEPELTSATAEAELSEVL